MSKHRLGTLFVVLAATLWGIHGGISKYLFRSTITPLQLVEIRLTLSALLLFVVLAVFARRLLRVSRANLWRLVIQGAIGFAGVQFTYYLAISLTTVATAVFLQYLYPAMVTVYACLVEREKLTKNRLIALGLATVGSAGIFIGTTGIKSIGSVGLLIGLAAAGFAAFYTVYGRYVMRYHEPVTVLTYGFGFGALVFWVISPPWGIPLETFSGTNWLYFVYVVVFGTVVPFGLYFTGMKWLSASQASITSTLEPVVAALTAFLIPVIHETLTIPQGIGCAAVVAAVMTLAYPEKNRDPSTATTVKGSGIHPK